MGSLNFNLGFNYKKKDIGYKYKDISMPITVDDVSYDIEDLKDLNSIRNGLYNIFQWRRGERILNPEFGLNLEEYLYEPIQESTTRNITNQIRLDIERWEPRINLEEVFVTANEDQNSYEITIQYSITNLNTTDRISIEL